MPYQTTSDLPESVRGHLPPHAQDIFLHAFNSAWHEYADAAKRAGDESQEQAAFRVAWAAVKHEYQKNAATGQWEPKHAPAH
jgi:cation transport regulator